MMRRERELDRALAHFRNYLRVRGYRLSVDASLHLREHMTVAERKRRIEEALSKREKTSEELTEGFSRLADESLRFARAQRRTTVETADVRRAIVELRCKVWPFCE